MKYISIDEVVAIHFELIKQFGGSQGIRDFGLLHSAIERSKASFGGEELYPSIYNKAAALLHSLILNHPFIDGNKRTAYMSTARFLGMNGYSFNVNRKMLIQFILEVEKGEPGMDAITGWLKNNTVRIA